MISCVCECESIIIIFMCNLFMVLVFRHHFSFEIGLTFLKQSARPCHQPSTANKNFNIWNESKQNDVHKEASDDYDDE